jgi:NADH:ubiquinone oxidoreductase subunit 6 (subunit J)
MNKVIGYFSAALVFISAVMFLGDQQHVDQNFKATIDILFVPALLSFAALVALVKVKQFKEGASL